MTDQYDEDGDCLVLTDEDRESLMDELDSINAELMNTQELATIRELGRRKRHLADEMEAGRRLELVEETARYDYEIVPRAAHIGGGWRLYLLDNGEEVGGGGFPVVADAAAAYAWWDGLDTEQRQHWTTKTHSTDPVKIHFSSLLEDAWFDASNAAGEWLDSRPQG